MPDDERGAGRIPRPPHREPEWVGPDTRREDMTGVSERKLALRAVHEALLTRQDVHLWIQQHTRLEKRVDAQEGRHQILVGRVDALEVAVGIVLPPMRQRFESSHDVARVVGEQIANTIEADSRNPDTPSPPPLEKVKAISEDVVRVAVDRLKAEQWDKLENERKHAEEDRLALESITAQGRRSAKWKLVGMAIVSVGSAIGWIVEHFVK